MGTNRMAGIVLLDLDGTIVNTEPGIIDCVRYSYEAFGYEVPDVDVLRSYIGPPLRHSFMQYCQASEAQADAMVAKYRERYVPVGLFECELYPGVEDFLLWLRQEGYVVALASSKPEEMCKKILGNFHLTGYFDEIVGATPDGRIDTKLEVLTEVFRRIQPGSPDEVVLIGDTRFDAIGGREAGIRVVGVTYGFGTREELEAEGAVVCDDLEAVKRYLKGA